MNLGPTDIILLLLLVFLEIFYSPYMVQNIK